MDLGFFNALSFTGWLIALLLLAGSLARRSRTSASCCCRSRRPPSCWGWRFPSTRLVTEAAQWRLELHILISITAHALLALAAVQSLLLAVQERRCARAVWAASRADCRRW